MPFYRKSLQFHNLPLQKVRESIILQQTIYYTKWLQNQHISRKHAQNGGRPKRYFIILANEIVRVITERNMCTTFEENHLYLSLSKKKVEAKS